MKTNNREFSKEEILMAKFLKGSYQETSRKGKLKTHCDSISSYTK